jgi:biopolymer transport protein ExbD
MGGVSEPMPGGKGKKSLVVDLNLVPFIDLLTVCITFLLLTAVWTQTGRINIDQSVQKPQKVEPQKEPPKRLTIMIDEKGYSLKWADEPVQTIPAGGGIYDTERLKEELKKLKERLPKDQRVIVAPKDTIPYKEMIAVMDTCMSLGLSNIMVADAASVAGEMM